MWLENVLYWQHILLYTNIQHICELGLYVYFIFYFFIFLFFGNIEYFLICFTLSFASINIEHVFKDVYMVRNIY